MNYLNLIDFYSEINQLKSTLRYCAKVHNVEERFIESTADHSWRLTFMVIDLCNKLNLDLDVMKAAKIALVHDLCEYNLEQDVTAVDVDLGGSSQKDKYFLEQQVMKDLANNFMRDDIYQLWMEQLEQKTKESKFVKALDKIEAVLHMINRDGDLLSNEREYIAMYCDKYVTKFPELLPFYNVIKQKLKEYFLRKGYSWSNDWDIKLEKELKEAK